MSAQTQPSLLPTPPTKITFFFLIFLLLRINSIPFDVEAAPNYFDHFCDNTTLFTSKSTYQNNPKTVLSTLASSSTSTTVAGTGFSNATSGNAQADKAYGLFLCRGDISNATCSDCVATATHEIFQRCPNQRASLIWYDECVLRYSDQSILSVKQQDPCSWTSDTVNISDPTLFMQVLGDAMKKSAYQASSGVSKKVGAGQAAFTSLLELYTLVQCTPDLSSDDCNVCLQILFGYLPMDKQGGRAFTPSCRGRFEFYPFYNASAITEARLAPAPPPTQLPPLPGAKGGLIKFPVGISKYLRLKI